MTGAVEIPITRGKVALVSPEDAGRIQGCQWYANPRGFAHGYPHGAAYGLVKMHRFIMNAPDGMVVDHIDGNPLNNIRENLRICTDMDNARNSRRQTGVTGFRGVWPTGNNDKPYRAIICVERKRVHIGVFSTPKKAALAYDDAARKYHGAFATLNFPENKA